MNFKYIIVSPGGNDTALVEGVNFSKEERKEINDYIMNKNKNVEQVGFIDKEKKILKMAGGEFCGNATRSAAYIFLDGKVGELKIKVNEDEKIINAGVTSNNLAWCEIPLYTGKDAVVKLYEDVYKVKMQGMTTIVIKENLAKKNLAQKEKLKEITSKIIDTLDLRNNEAVGVMYLEKEKEKYKMHPVVWVKLVDTLFYETACGSGSTAVAMVESYLKKESSKIEIIQPSGKSIIAQNIYKNGQIELARILGNIEIIRKECYYGK